MQALLTKREAAEALGRSERWVEQNADRFAMERAAEERARNGRPVLRIHLHSLPPEAQRAWAERHRKKVVEIAPAAEASAGQLALGLTMPEAPNLSIEDRAEAERRYTIIEPLVAPERHRKLWAAHSERSGAVIAFLARQHQVSVRSIYAWLKSFKDGGLPALVTKDRVDRGRPRVFNQAALAFLLAASLPKKGCYGNLSIREIYRAYIEERAWRAAHAATPLEEFGKAKYAGWLDEAGCLKPDAQLPEASYETFRAWAGKIPDAVKVMARDGADKYSATQEILSFRELSQIQPLEYLVMDHRRLDLFCMTRYRGGWRLVRPWLTAAIDMRTRKWLGWSIVETPSSDSIASVLKRVFLDWGLPQACYWDNGKDFVCEWLEGRQRRQGESYRVTEFDAATRGVLESLGIRVHHAIVKRARSKIIEPNFLNTSWFDKNTPWWCGHRPDARPERLERLVREHEDWVEGRRADPVFRTIEEIAALYDEFLKSLNEREHTGEGMEKITPNGRGWMCPNECWERLIRNVPKRTAPPEVLQFCFHKRKTLTVRNGGVQQTFGGRTFHYRMPSNPVQLMALNGREVELSYDPHDLGTAALYFEGRFLGLVENIELRRMGEDAFVEDERERRAARREVKDFIRQVHRAVHIPDVMERAARRRDVRPARIEPERIEEPAAVPAAIAAACAAANEERDFSFGQAVTALDVVAPADNSGDDGAFQFFSN